MDENEDSNDTVIFSSQDNQISDVIFISDDNNSRDPDDQLSSPCVVYDSDYFPTPKNISSHLETIEGSLTIYEDFVSPDDPPSSPCVVYDSDYGFSTPQKICSRTEEFYEEHETAFLNDFGKQVFLYFVFRDFLVNQGVKNLIKPKKNQSTQV
jgi:hypothetical protein